MFPVWLAGTDATPLALHVVATADVDSNVRVALLGPLVDGKRMVLGAGGYSAARAAIDLLARTTEAGEHLVVVGSFELATETSFTVATYCDGC
ncbi:MAG: hypothetical protein H0T79_13270, partial [Deltaproteobacteria bacterium]|nr:hypothetical protein [Deltaproteobacteria bacterium]